ncbi:hypothetical protein SK128_000501, partial [Halocaridina rubra]
MLRNADNRCVTVGLNFDTVEPLAKVQHWVKDSNTRGNIPQPIAIHSYNESICGMDHHDWL